MSAAETALAAAVLTEQYETLRTAAFGDGLPPDARSGLALFLRRGMLGWARSAIVAGRPMEPARSFFPSLNTNSGHRAVIHLFAAMAIRSAKSRTHERSTQSPDATPRA